jgi:hypothetical protein
VLSSICAAFARKFCTISGFRAKWFPAWNTAIRRAFGDTVKRWKVLVFSMSCRFIHRALAWAGDNFANAPFALFSADPA